jgi:hypothetical protein
MFSFPRGLLRVFERSCTWPSVISYESNRFTLKPKCYAILLRVSSTVFFCCHLICTSIICIKYVGRSKKVSSNVRFNNQFLCYIWNVWRQYKCSEVKIGLWPFEFLRHVSQTLTTWTCVLTVSPSLCQSFPLCSLPCLAYSFMVSGIAHTLSCGCCPRLWLQCMVQHH